MALSYLDAAKVVLSRVNRPLTSRELTAIAIKDGLLLASGSTPHKTMNARISEDIVANATSDFMRSGPGQFALRAWSAEVPEFHSRPRTINPIDEDILVVPKDIFLPLLASSPSIFREFYDVNLVALLESTISMKRIDVEEDNDFVQIVSLFHVIVNDKLLTYNRTSRLPEKRLHHLRSINFGGHMINRDRAPMLEKFLSEEMPVIFSRELHEELRFDTMPTEITYTGSLYSQVDAFSKRHLGVSFEVVAPSPEIDSAEPGFHTSVEAMSIDEIIRRASDFDDWTRLVMERMGYGHHRAD